MTFKTRLLAVLRRHRRELQHIEYMGASLSLADRLAEPSYDYQLIRMYDLECRLINKLNRLGD